LRDLAGLHSIYYADRAGNYFEMTDRQRATPKTYERTMSRWVFSLSNQTLRLQTVFAVDENGNCMFRNIKQKQTKTQTQNININIRRNYG